MSLDILSALEATPGGKSGGHCKVQRWLDSIPADAPGRDALEVAFTTTDPHSPDYRTYDQLLAIAAQLDCRTSDKTIAAHRNQTCRCNW